MSDAAVRTKSAARTGPSKVVVRAWARLMRAQRRALATVERALKQAGLPPLVWYDVLLELERAGSDGLRPFELEREMLMAQYNLSRLIDRLQATGYVARNTCAGDGRGLVITITRAGLAMRRRMWPVYAAAIQSAISERLNEAQAARLAALLGHLT